MAKMYCHCWSQIELVFAHLMGHQLIKLCLPSAVERPKCSQPFIEVPFVIVYSWACQVFLIPISVCGRVPRSYLNLTLRLDAFD